MKLTTSQLSAPLTGQERQGRSLKLVVRGKYWPIWFVGQRPVKHFLHHHHPLPSPLPPHTEDKNKSVERMWLLLQVRLSFVRSWGGDMWRQNWDDKHYRGDTVSNSSHYQVITVKTIWFWNNNFPPQEKFQLPLEFENNKVNHDLRFFFNKPVWCSWTFPVKNQTQTHQLLEPLLSIEVTWLWLKFIVRIERKPQQRATLRSCKWWLNIPAQVRVRILQTGAGGTSSSPPPYHACAADEDKKPEARGGQLSDWGWTSLPDLHHHLQSPRVEERAASGIQTKSW